MLVSRRAVSAAKGRARVPGEKAAHAAAAAHASTWRDIVKVACVLIDKAPRLRARWKLITRDVSTHRVVDGAAHGIAELHIPQTAVRAKIAAVVLADARTQGR